MCVCVCACGVWEREVVEEKVVEGGGDGGEVVEGRWWRERWRERWWLVR